MQSPDATDQPDPHAALMRHFAENAEACMQTAQEGLFQLDLAAQLLADTVARGYRAALNCLGDSAPPCLHLGEEMHARAKRLFEFFFPHGLNFGRERFERV